MSDARILDRGYRRYDGERRGTRGAVSSLSRQSALRALGLRRTFWAKVFPLLSAVIAYLPATVFVGIAALFPDQLLDPDAVIPTYGDYYGFITAAIIVFVALVGPEVLCPDRRDGMLGLYLASPLTRDTYLLAKALAVVPVIAIVTVGPPLLLLVGRTFADAGPDSIADFLGILLLLVSSVATNVLVELGGDERLLLLNLFLLPFELVQRIYGEMGAEPGLTTVELVAANLAWTVGASLLVRERYRRLQVTR